MVLIWGRIADRLSIRTVTAVANIIVALALVLFVNVKSAYPGLLLIRLLFSIGASGITTVLTASLSVLSASAVVMPANTITPTISQDSSESQPLLGWRRRITPPTENGGIIKKRPAALSAFLGISAGTGALLAVFLFLRIPSWLPSLNNPANQSIRNLRIAFYIVAGIALLNAIIAFVFLPSKTQDIHSSARDTGTLSYIKHEIGQIFNGFRLAGKNANIALACAGGFAARAQTISVSAFVPLYVASYFFKQGLCNPSSHEELKQSCHEAYALASAISGVTQLVALLSGVAFVWVTRLSRTLAFTSLLGCVSFAILGRSAFGPFFGGENPKNLATWIASLGIGIAQTGSVTISLALIAKERARLQDEKSSAESIAHGEDSTEEGYQVEESPSISKRGHESGNGETAGALAGAYSFCGGLGVLSVSALAGLLPSTAAAGAPFLGIAAVDLLLAIGAIAVTMRNVQP